MTKARQLADLGNAYDDGALSNRNLIINGAMQVAQRGTSFSPPSQGAYVVDRFHQYQGGGGVLYYEQSTDAPLGFSNSLKITVNTADSSIASGDYYYMRYEAEGLDCSRLSLGTSNAQKFTLSFYVKSSLTGTFSGAFQNAATNRSYVFEYTINLANTWERKTVTVDGDTSGTWLTNNSVGLRVAFDLGNGSSLRSSAGSWASSGNYGSTGSVELVGTASATLYITGVQLEVGDTATPFEHRSYGDELAKCQRYYQHTYSTGSAVGTATHDNMIGSGGAQGNSSSSEVSGGTYTFKVEMRAAPTITFYDHLGNSARCSRLNAAVAWYGNSNVGTSIATTTSSVKPQSPNGSTATGMYCHIVADAEL
jgi:hypothetical protein